MPGCSSLVAMGTNIWVPDVAQVYSLDKAGDYRQQVDTQRLGVPYFVRNMAALDKSHPPGSRDRRAQMAFCSALCARGRIRAVALQRGGVLSSTRTSLGCMISGWTWFQQPIAWQHSLQWVC